MAEGDRAAQLRAFAAFLEKAAEARQRGLLGEAWVALNGPIPGGGPGWLVWHRFVRMLDADAYESAAMTLVPDGWGLWIERADEGDSADARLGRRNPLTDDLEQHSATSSTPAFAIASACLLVHAAYPISMPEVAHV